MKNVTISMKDEVAHWVRIKAAEADTSVSKFMGDMAESQMEAEQAYDAAMRRFLSLESRPLSKPGERYPSREELHDRAGLR